MGIDNITEVNKNIDEIEHIEKFNPFHDSRGRFSNSHGMSSYSANPKTKAGQMAIARSTAAGYGAVMNVHRESKGENIRQNDNWVRSGQKPNKSQLARAQANAPKTVAQARQNAHTNRVKGTMGATETAQAKHPQNARRAAVNAARAQAAQNASAKQQQGPAQTTTKPKPNATAQQQNQQAQQQQAQQNAKTVHVTQKMKSGITMDVDFDQSNVKGALNKEFKGTAEGKDLTKSFDATKMRATDSYSGQNRYSDKAADMQGFNSPGKKVSQAEFDQLKKQCGDVFYRTVGSATIDGKHLSASEFKQTYTNKNDLGMNGPSGRVYGDGIYTASAKTISKSRGKTTIDKHDEQRALNESRWYGDGHTTLSMTWLSKPKVTSEAAMTTEFYKLSSSERKKYGNHVNTYAIAKGYDAMVTDNRTDGYFVIFNRSKLAILDD